MKALLYKDLVSGKSTYLLALVIMLFVAFYVTSNGAIILIPILFVFMPMLLNTVSFRNESTSDFPKFAFTTPITREDYVKSKYGVAILFGIMALISGFILFYHEYESLNLALIIGAAFFALPIIISAIQIPFILKFNEEKGGIIVVATNFLIFALAHFLGDSLGRLIIQIQKLSYLNVYLTAGVIFAITIIVFTVSKNIGVAITKRKEY